MDQDQDQEQFLVTYFIPAPDPPVEPSKYSLKVVMYFRQIGSGLGCSLKLAMCIHN